MTAAALYRFFLEPTNQVTILKTLVWTYVGSYVVGAVHCSALGLFSAPNMVGKFSSYGLVRCGRRLQTCLTLHYIVGKFHRFLSCN